MNYKLIYVHCISARIEEQLQEFVFEKEFILPFPPYHGLVIKDLNQREDLPWSSQRWEVSMDTYWCIQKECFICETKQHVTSNNVEFILKQYNSFGWKRIK